MGSSEDLPENPLGDSQEDPCPQCGVKVRRGVVRCWNCQAFMRPEIEQKYQLMQDSPRPVIYSHFDSSSRPLEEHRERPTTELPVAAAHDTSPDDFDLAPDVAVYAEDDDFELESETSTPYHVQRAPQSAPAPANPPANTPDPDGYAIAEPVVETPAAAAGETPTPKPSQDVPAVDHSVATGGEVLWEIARQEEQKKKSRPEQKRKNVKVRPGSILVYCPFGHRIEVQERHRGRLGKCPKCKAPFTVPMIERPSDRAEAGAAADAPREFPNHFPDCHIHPVDPTKLKLKPGSLAKSFETYDLCLTGEGLLMVSLAKKGGLFGGGKKADDVRKELLEHLAAELKLKSAPGESKHVFDPEELKQLKVVHPTAYSHESIFGGINVFGPGQIAIRLPKRTEGKLEFLTLTLSQFRKLNEQLASQCGVSLDFEEDQIPLKDKTTPGLCHYTDQPIRALDKLEFYQNDPAFELEQVGWKCQACGLTLSEDGRKKENIGGKNGKSIAKAKCPKCKNAMGHNPLFNLKAAPAPKVEEPAEA